MLAGYTRSRNQIENVSVDVSPNFLINMNGNISPDSSVGGSSRCSGCGASNADKPNQFKLTGMYILPWQELIISGNYSGVSGPPITRQISRALAIGGSQTINLEPLGSRRLDFQNRIDVRVGKLFTFAGVAHARSVDRLRQPDQCQLGVAGALADAGDVVPRSVDRPAERR